jgi:Protein of unknown function (DUF2934)
MAKAKERPSAASSTKSGGARTPASRPTQARKPTKAAPDTPQVRPPARETSGNTQPKLSPEDVYRLIQERAYFKAKERDFAPGHEVQDWIEAEQEVRRRLEGRT